MATIIHKLGWDGDGVVELVRVMLGQALGALILAWRVDVAGRLTGMRVEVGRSADER